MRSTLIGLMAFLLAVASTTGHSYEEHLSSVPETHEGEPVAHVESDQRPRLIGVPRKLEVDAGPSIGEIITSGVRPKRQIIYGDFYTTEDSDLEGKKLH